MSRRRATWTTTDGVTADELLDACYGQRYRHPHAPMPGCSARCCGAPAPTPARWSVAWEQGWGWSIVAVSLAVGLWRLL